MFSNHKMLYISPTLKISDLPSAKFESIFSLLLWTQVDVISALRSDRRPARELLYRTWGQNNSYKSLSVKELRWFVVEEEKVDQPKRLKKQYSGGNNVTQLWFIYHNGRYTFKAKFSNLLLVLVLLPDCLRVAVKAHRLVLISASLYFQNVLQRIGPAQHPVLFLSGVHLSELHVLLDYMYCREVFKLFFQFIETSLQKMRCWKRWLILVHFLFFMNLKRMRKEVTDDL